MIASGTVTDVYKSYHYALGHTTMIEEHYVEEHNWENLLHIELLGRWGRLFLDQWKYYLSLVYTVHTIATRNKGL
jgi:hypothetical protein